ncbi:putative cytochrome P450, partial [Pseudolycoriella hygida]
MSTYLIVFIIVVATTFWVWNHRREIKLSWLMPGPFPIIPLVGVAWRFFVEENLDAINSFLKPYENCEKPIGCWLGTKFLIFVDNPRDIETVLTSPNCVRDEMYQYIKDTIGYDGIFTSEGEVWRKHRRLVSPSFSEKVVMSYVKIFARLSRDLIKNLRKMLNKEPFDIRRYISDFTLDAFFAATFSVDVDADERVMFHRNMKFGQSLIGKRFFLPWYQSEWIWKITGYSKLTEKVARESIDGMNKVVQKLIDNGSSEITFLERLLRISEETDEFTLDDVKAEAITALIAGSDTSAASIAYTLLLLAMHPDHQERVFDELKTILPSKDTAICAEHIPKMKYLEVCISESLRLFPVVSLMSKMVKNGSINLSGYTVHPGVSIVIGVNRVQRKMKYWGPDANKFDPRRFLPENIMKVNRFAYIPFSDGSRNCVGYKYAYVAMKSILAHILRNYRLTTPLKLEDLKLRMRVNIYLLNKHMVQIYERNE